MTRVQPSGIRDDIRAHCGHWAIAQENSGFLFYRLDNASGGRQDRKQFHPAMTGRELNKTTEISWNEESDATCNIGRSALKRPNARKYIQRTSA
jgi:hypothetical protein